LALDVKLIGGLKAQENNMSHFMRQNLKKSCAETMIKDGEHAR